MKTKTFYATNEIDPDGKEGIDEEMRRRLQLYTPSDMARKNDDPGVPVHELVLKVGDICLLLQTISCLTKLGAVNNSRVRILDFTDHGIKVSQIKADGRDGKIFTISRRHFTGIPLGQHATFRRTQFPLALAYAVSIHKVICVGVLGIRIRT